MSWASEQAIQEHNARIESDEAYAENYFRQMAEEEAFYMWRELQCEKDEDWFDDYRIDYTGFEEIDVHNPELIDDDIPF